MEGVVPAQVDQKEGAAAVHRQQVVLLVGMEVELPGAGLGVVGGLTAGPVCTTRSLALEVGTVMSKKRTAGVSRNFS